MRHLRPTASVLMALGLVLAGVGGVAAKGGDAIATLDEPLPPGPAAGSTITIGWSLDLQQDDGTTLPFWAEGVFLRFTPPSGASFDAPGRQDRQGHFTRQGRGARGRPGRRRVRDARRHVFPGHLRLELRVLPRRGHDRRRGRRCRGAGEDRGRACPGPRSAARGGGGPGARGARRRSRGEPDHADSSRPGAADGSLRRRRLAGRAHGHRSCADRDRHRGARSRPDERGLTVRPSDGRPPTAPRPGGGAGGAAQSSRASSATSRTRSMNRYSQSSALISAIFPASAGCVLISRSWSSDATW